MSEHLKLLLALMAGGLLSTMFFGGLWWTIRKATSSKQPGLWFFGSLMLRLSAALTGFYFTWGGHLDRLLACLLGFVIASFVVTRLLRPSRESRHRQGQGAVHAPYSR